jgi:hypothetical protein
LTVLRPLGLRGIKAFGFTAAQARGFRSYQGAGWEKSAPRMSKKLNS